MHQLTKVEVWTIGSWAGKNLGGNILALVGDEMGKWFYIATPFNDISYGVDIVTKLIQIAWDTPRCAKTREELLASIISHWRTELPKIGMALEE